ncbi:MAG: BlaI/MecI/CopY family transcriptional regulator [Planctomycetes bacterium]|nr:BlaI/MecI/CopY family transcriptional regulator [Planctomycetota bacterium]
MAGHEYDLGSAELEVLKVLWDQGPAPVRSVLNALHRSGRRVAYTTVQTTLTRLEQKRFVRSNRSDLAFVYRATVSRERFSRKRLSKLVNQLYDGAAGPLVLQLMRTGRFSAAEISELQALVERLDAKRGS